MWIHLYLLYLHIRLCFGLACSPKGLNAQALVTDPLQHWEAVEPSGGRPSWEEVKSLTTHSWKEYWDPSLSLCLRLFQPPWSKQLCPTMYPDVPQQLSEQTPPSFKVDRLCYFATAMKSWWTQAKYYIPRDCFSWAYPPARHLLGT